MQPYDERLTAPRSWWLTIPLLAGLTLGLVVLPLGPLPMLAALVAGAAVAAAAVSAYGSVRVRVVADSLVAGSARIPLSALGTATALDAEEARAWRTHKADPRAFMVLRAYVPTAVRIEVTDPQDPTPYVYLSTRRPQRLVSALGEGASAAR
ncbi:MULTISPECIES: DUF3093 domain-containing protein [Streptomyces]|uniref:DUF3093 domain-containing protein n=1 Tax=Streptomyces TaxID=1883 RepID=UPI002248812E|nr:DUF3093 domain-containing protein [Streptomyces sp. JHD 1]MCX2969502.1 DUF3093 domain-containing protein [Streptomyces sp. JHD 1]